MDPKLLLGLLLAVVIVQRLTELRLAKRNEAWARQQGAIEHGARHYPLFFILHTGWLLAWPIESWLAGPQLASRWWLWLTAFVAAQALRYWAIAALGKRWNTRILVLPGKPLVTRGPYRLLPHPNYLAVIVELAALPLLFNAWWTATIVGLLNLALLFAIRIPTESKALNATSGATSGT